MVKTQKSESEQLNFFEKCYEKFLQATDAVGEIKHFYRVGGSTICLSFAGNELISFLAPALEHLRINEAVSADLTLHIWDSHSTGIDMVPPPCERKCFTDRGDIWGFHSKRIKTAFHWIEFSVNVMDLDSGKGIFWVENADSLPFWVYASPLRTLLHWWMEKKGLQLLHAAAVGTPYGAVLITGKGGSGKSTTALSCLQAGFFYLADDYVIIQLDPVAQVHSLYCTAKLDPDQLNSLPEFRKYVDNHEKLDQEKAVMFLHPHLKKQIIPNMVLKAVFMPMITDRETTVLTPISYWRIQRAMSFTTMSQLPAVGYHTHEFINRVSQTIPSYSLELGSDIRKIPNLISEFLQKPSMAQNEKHDKKSIPAHSKSLPLVSVIVPVYNGERFIREAVENIIAQNYPPIEIIVVDDGSTDKTGEIINQIPKDIRYFYQENEGPASARNRGIRDASGEFIAFLDVDDIWPENNLNILVEHLLKKPDILVVRGYAQLIEVSPETGNQNFIGNPKESFADYIGAALYRKSVFREVGLFNQELTCGEDTDWFKRASSRNIPMQRIEEVTLHVRRHGANMTLDKKFMQVNKLHIFKQTLDTVRALHLDLKGVTR